MIFYFYVVHRMCKERSPRYVGLIYEFMETTVDVLVSGMGHGTGPINAEGHVHRWSMRRGTISRSIVERRGITSRAIPGPYGARA